MHAPREWTHMVFLNIETKFQLQKFKEEFTAEINVKPNTGTIERTNEANENSGDWQDEDGRVDKTWSKTEESEC